MLLLLHRLSGRAWCLRPPAGRARRGALSFAGSGATASLGLALAVAAGMPPAVGATCGGTVTVAAGDTVSAIATRCGVSEGKILRLNPAIEGSADLREGMTLSLSAPAPDGRQDAGGNSSGNTRSGKKTVDQLQQAGKSALERLKQAGSKASDTLEGFARDVGSSAEDLLNSNPDLHQRLLRLGEKFNGKAGPQVSVSPDNAAPGGRVTLSAVNLPANVRIAVRGATSGSEERTIEQAWTSARGTLQLTLPVPDWAQAGSEFRFVIAYEPTGLAVSTEPVRVSAAVQPAR